MKKKIIFQIIIILIIITISALVYYKYFKIDKINKIETEENKNIVKNNEIKDSIDFEENEINIIENIKYFKEDIYGNEFTLKAEKGEITQNDTENIILVNVYGIINLKNESKIFIFSKYAKYNSNNFDTKFYTDVKATYEDMIVKSENLDLFFKDNYGEMYNNINFTSKDSEIKADKLFFDLANGDIKINMYNSDDKITIIKN